MIDLDISKLFIILGFLGALILVQLIVKRSTIFSKLFTGPSPTLLKVINKVSVSNYSTASVLQYEDMSDMTAAGISMDGVTRGQKDRPEFDINSLPLPIKRRRALY